MENNWYVYRHVRLDNNEPFYIGIGNKKNYYRAYETKPDRRNEIWTKINLKTDINVEIIFYGLTKFQASEKEQEFIKLYGRKDLNTGPLCNMTDGGDGIWNCKRSEDTKQKLREQKIGDKNPMFGKKNSKETKLKRIKSLTGQKRSEEVKIKQSLSSIKSGQAKKTLLMNFYTKEVIGIYHSISEACRIVGLCPKNDGSKASMVANGKRNQVKGYSFKYI
jgi:hypothetical protein